MKRLLVAAALAPLSFAAAAQAQQSISSATTTPVTTSTGGDVTITANGSISPTTGGTQTAPVGAVTVNSYNNVSNAGTIAYVSQNYTSGILVQGVAPPSSSSAALTITNTGAISDAEPTSYKDTNGDYIDDTNGSNPVGQNLYATGANRFGIVTTGSAFNGSITNSGTIAIVGENSAGISIGANGITGALLQNGTITATGGNPAILDTTNGYSNAGTDITYGIQSIGVIGGSATIAGTITVQGKNATGVALDGGVGGAAGGTGLVEINATITDTGYESTSPYQISSIPALIQAQAAEELLQSGPAVRIQGVVTGGISFDPVIAATGTTPGVAGAVINSSSSAPAVQIGGATPTVISPIVASTLTSFPASAGYGLAVGGTVSGLGVFAFDDQLHPVDATGILIGGPNAAPVTVNGGISISGVVSASTAGAPVTTASGDTGTGNPVALWIDNASLTVNTTTALGANNGAINISGSVLASAQTQTVAGTSLTAVGAPAGSNNVITPVQATAILLGPNAHVASIVNAGSIEANIGGLSGLIITAGGGTQGYATGIKDQSGGLTSITNEDAIGASVTPILANVSADPAYSQSVAIDLRNNTTGATINQNDAGVVAISSTTGLATTVVPTISGDILFGSGNGVLNLNAGIVAGGLQFGAASGNAININNGAVAVGDLAETNGGALAINIQNGVLGVDAPVTNELASTYDATNHVSPPTVQVPQTNQVAIGVSSLTIGANGQLAMSVYAPNATYPVSQVGAPQLSVGPGGVNIASGGAIGLNFLSKLTQAATYNLIVSQGAINVANTSNALGALPFLYQGALSVGTYNGENAIALTVSQKSAAQLGLNAAQAAAFNAFYAAFDKADLPATGDTSGEAVGTVSNAVLSANSKASFDHIYNQFLPDYSGGPFETLAMGQDALAAAEADTPPKLGQEGSHGWVQEIGFSEDRSSAGVVGFGGKGYGFAGGTESVSGRNAVGFAMAILSTTVNDTGRPVGSSQTATAVEGGVYWRDGGEGLNLGASLNGGLAFMQSNRVLLDQSGSDDATFLREAKASWDGAIGAATVSAAYKASFGRFFIEPEALAEYVLLYESAYAETGGGDAVDLSVNSKLSQQGVVQADMVLGANFGTALVWTPQLTIGWRQIVAGGPANTVAHFSGGSSFTLAPDYQNLKSGLLARLGLRASGQFADFSANAGGVFGSDYDAVDARATARFLF